MKLAENRPDALRFCRRVSAIRRIVPNEPSRRHDLVELLLECGHRYQEPRPKRRGSSDGQRPLTDLLDSRILCRKCAELERILRKNAMRRALRRPHGVPALRTL